MDQAAVSAALNCLERAKEALASLENGGSFDKMEGAWTDFLVMANRVYVKLEQGAKVSGKSKAWFGRKKSERRNDPLLSYIKNARDADEHGLARITERTSGSIGVNATEGVPWSGHIKSTEIGAEISLHSDAPGASATFSITPPNVRLVEVVNYGDRYPAPTTHMGNPVPNPVLNAYPHPVAVGQLAVSHLDALIAEARALP